MGQGFVPDVCVAEGNSENLCPLAFHREIVSGIPDRLGRGLPLARFDDLPCAA